MSLKGKRITRTAEVTIETEESLVFGASANRRRQTAWCPSCRREAAMVSPEHAARIAGVGTRTVYAWVEAETIHLAESPEGSLLVCLDSLIAAASPAGRPAKQLSPCGRK